VSTHPAEHPKQYPYRWFPTEMTLVNDLPVNHTPAKARQVLGGMPPIMAYFLDDNAHHREKDAFWVRGESRADVMLRAPIVIEHRDNHERVRPLRVDRLEVQLETGPVANRVTVWTGAETQVVEIPPNDRRTVVVRMPQGVPYRRDPWLPTNYIYMMSVESETSFVPMFHSGSSDARFLGIFVRLIPRYE
jgi:hypothetical protein